jgi:hypothetical protein
MKVKLLPKLILFALVVGGGVGLFRHLVYTGVIPRPSALKSLIPVKAEEINAEVINTVGNVKAVDLGSTKSMRPCVDGNTSNCLNGPTHEMEIWAWNANGGLILATGVTIVWGSAATYCSGATASLFRTLFAVG